MRDERVPEGLEVLAAQPIEAVEPSLELVEAVVDGGPRVPAGAEAVVDLADRPLDARIEQAADRRADQAREASAGGPGCALDGRDAGSLRRLG